MKAREGGALTIKRSADWRDQSLLLNTTACSCVFFGGNIKGGGDSPHAKNSTRKLHIKVSIKKSDTVFKRV